ncbi:MAG TPA: membrane protein insertion efficiency factor YidD [Methylibium sp.]
MTPLQLWPRRALMLPIKAYRLLLSPWLGSACRFEPTCSVYALQAVDRHGAAAGSYLAAARLLRCHPWCDGGLDAVPEAPPRLFSRLKAVQVAGLTDPTRTESSS